MSTIPIKEIGDFLEFVSGVAFLLIAIIFIFLFKRYRKRDYLLIFLGSIAGSAYMVVGNLDVIFPEDWESELPELLAGLFSFIMVTIIFTILIYPDKIPINFEEHLYNTSEEEE
ncbi:MAG: hypothetical protein INQ03_18970 [Candidatus Heimdallarchaeota archaeon]|nr:hypothetical protein [Candidatus Heimdallarchaeota archaeon]